MSREHALDDIVTAFLLNTCRWCPPSRSKYAVHAATQCGMTVTIRSVHEDFRRVPLVTGSAAEFYIEPMLPHVDDIDVMFHQSDQLAIPRGHPPPTQLPAEFHNHVYAFEITKSHLPAYVYLPLRYLLTECTDDDNYMYNAVECDEQMYLSNGLIHRFGLERHGPATFIPSLEEQDLSIDQVPCVRCLSWPPQAADWSTRSRSYGWPDSATLDRVVGNGCDVVGVAHRQCRQDEWMKKYQWRLSFSRAEVALINSWMPVQQIVYHMFRFVKSEFINISIDQSTDSADNSAAGKLSNYHFKTLMLWACELRPRSWWIDDVNLMRMCVELLHIFAEWLTYGRFQHYFISNCNLIDNSLNVTIVRDKLMSADKTWLSAWFVDNYVQKCLQLNDCPQNVSLLSGDIMPQKLQNAVSVLVAWKQNRSLLDLLKAFNDAEIYILTTMYIIDCLTGLTAHSCVRWMTEWTKIDSHLPIYFKAVTFLHVASKLVKHRLNDELMDILATVCGLFTDTRCTPNSCHFTSVLSLNVAVKLMKVVANKSLSTMSLIEIELSMAYLRRALRCNDCDSDSIYCPWQTSTWQFCTALQDNTRRR